MKQATGNLASGLVAAVCIGVLAVFFYFTVWPMIKGNFESQTSCDKAVCTNAPDSNGMVDCSYKDKTFKCKYKG